MAERADGRLHFDVDIRLQMKRAPVFIDMSDQYGYDWIIIYDNFIRMPLCQWKLVTSLGQLIARCAFPVPFNAGRDVPLNYKSGR